MRNIKTFTIGTLDRVHKLIAFRLYGQGAIRPTIRTKWNSVWAKNYRKASDHQMIEDIEAWLVEAKKATGYKKIIKKTVKKIKPKK